jgi:hypothetical protein
VRAAVAGRANVAELLEAVVSILGYGEQAAMNVESRLLADADFTEQDRPTGEDHELHVAGKICAYCGKEINASQPARLAGEHDWVHEGCRKPRP